MSRVPFRRNVSFKLPRHIKLNTFISAWRKDRFEFPCEAKQVLKKSFLWTENAELLQSGKKNCTSEAWKRLRIWRRSALSVSKRKQYGDAVRPRTEGKRFYHFTVKIDNNICLQGESEGTESCRRTEVRKSSKAARAAEKIKRNTVHWLRQHLSVVLFFSWQQPDLQTNNWRKLQGRLTKIHIIIDIFSNGICWDLTWETNTKYFFILDMKRTVHWFQYLKNTVSMFVHKQLCVRSRKCLSVTEAVYKPDSVTPVQPGDLGQNSCNLRDICGRKFQIFGPNHIA